MNVVNIASNMTLERRATKIRNLMGDMVGNTLAIGAELLEARATFPVGPKNKLMGWPTWLRNEFKISSDWAGQLIRSYQKFGHLLADGKELPTQKVLNYLASDHVPDSGSAEVIARVRKGEKIGKDKAKKIIAKHLPSPKKANEMARDTGKPVTASDGYVYLGATEEQVKESTERRTVIYAVREAIEKIATLRMTADEWLEYAAPHQLWKAREEDQIERALDWMTALNKAWPKKRDQIRK